MLFLALMAQLYAPLNYFGSYYRTIQQYMIDMVSWNPAVHDRRDELEHLAPYCCAPSCSAYLGHCESWQKESNNT